MNLRLQVLEEEGPSPKAGFGIINVGLHGSVTGQLIGSVTGQLIPII
jgi:hypothetical protein